MALRRPYESDLPPNGILMSEEDFERLISEETNGRYELIDGLFYDMTGSSPKHSSLAGRIDFLLQLQIARSGPCRTHRDQYVAIPGKTPLCPDVVLTCDIADWDEDQAPRPFRIQSPLIVVEVLSPSTEKRDRGAKFAMYQSCPTLEVYILVSQYESLVEVYRRTNNWQQEIFASGQIIHLGQLDLELSVDDIYEGILRLL